MLDIDQLPHIDTLDNIEKNFRVYAGPGAGKTTWLISHLERVLRNSKRLGKTSQIGCITYTNVAADEIVNRLECNKSRFDISTIHSFLYRNIVRPFCYLIEKDHNGDDLFDISKLNGHDEHVIHGSRLRRWVSTIKKKNNKNYGYLLAASNRSSVANELTSLNYKFIGDSIELVINRNRGAAIPKSNGELWDYKLKYWRDGIMHHEDVLYFSYLILRQSPKVVEFIRNKFPYIFVDEFQDTTQLQTWILEEISATDTIVGVVGDLAQSIYRFAGAVRSDFLNFKKDNISSFKLNQNHRSSYKIVDFLNLLRKDIQQLYGDKTTEGSPVKVLIGPIESAKNWFENEQPDNTLYILTRTNTSVSEIRGQMDIVEEDLIDQMYANDSNGHRSKLIHSILRGLKYRDKADFKNSIKEVLRPLKRIGFDEVRKLDLRKIAVNVLDDLKTDEKRDQSIYSFYMALRQKVSDKYNFKIGAGLRSGYAKTFYENYTISNLLPHVQVDTRSEDKIRTIHSAKGTEFENTLVHFESSGDFRKYVLNAQDYIHSEKDDGRIYYVACSRAKKELFINIPEASTNDLEVIEDINMLPIEI